MISIVVPCFNESRGLVLLHERLARAIQSLPMSVEILFVDDGSEDDTVDVIHELQRADSHIGLLQLSRNFGKEAALTAGLEYARGDAVIVLDADLQDPPESIPEMVQAWREGYDIVAMKRADRSSDTFFKRKTAGWYYAILGKLTAVRIPQNVGDFRLLSRRAVDALSQLPERCRYMKGIFAWIGYRTIEIPYKREPRAAGDTKLPFLKLLALALDGITSFSIAPLRLASAAGAAVAVGALLYALAVFAKTLLYGDPVAGFPTLVIMISFLGGMQLLAIGLLGEYIGRLLIESKQRPTYLVDSVELPHFEPDIVSLPRRSAAIR
ncbi:MAG: glycosyltransferase family 2 protein [Woeseiaceae bacterium]